MSDSVIYSSVTLESDMPDSDVLDCDTPEPVMSDPALVNLTEPVLVEDIEQVIRDLWDAKEKLEAAAAATEEDDEDEVRSVVIEEEEERRDSFFENPLVDPELVDSELYDCELDFSELCLSEDSNPELVDSELYDSELYDPELEELDADLALHDSRDAASFSSDTPEPDSSSHSHVLTTPTLSDD